MKMIVGILKTAVHSPDVRLDAIVAVALHRCVEATVSPGITRQLHAEHWTHSKDVHSLDAKLMTH